MRANYSLLTYNEKGPTHIEKELLRMSKKNFYAVRYTPLLYYITSLQRRSVLVGLVAILVTSSIMSILSTLPIIIFQLSRSIQTYSSSTTSSIAPAVIGLRSVPLIRLLASTLSISPMPKIVVSLDIVAILQVRSLFLVLKSATLDNKTLALAYQILLDSTPISLSIFYYLTRLLVKSLSLSIKTSSAESFYEQVFEPQYPIVVFYILRITFPAARLLETFSNVCFRVWVELAE